MSYVFFCWIIFIVIVGLLLFILYVVTSLSCTAAAVVVVKTESNEKRKSTTRFFSFSFKKHNFSINILFNDYVVAMTIWFSSNCWYFPRLLFISFIKIHGISATIIVLEKMAYFNQPMLEVRQDNGKRVARGVTFSFCEANIFFLFFFIFTKEN